MDKRKHLTHIHHRHSYRSRPPTRPPTAAGRDRTDPLAVSRGDAHYRPTPRTLALLPLAPHHDRPCPPRPFARPAAFVAPRPRTTLITELPPSPTTTIGTPQSTARLSPISRRRPVDGSFDTDGRFTPPSDADRLFAPLPSHRSSHSADFGHAHVNARRSQLRPPPTDVSPQHSRAFDARPLPHTYRGHTAPLRPTHVPPIGRSYSWPTIDPAPPNMPHHF